MRLWPFRRLSPRGSVSSEDLLITEDVLRKNVEDLLTVRERQIFGNVIVFRGQLSVDPAAALELLLDRFGRYGYTPFLRPEPHGVAIQAWPLAQTIEPQRLGVNVALFVLTCLTTLFAGALMSGAFEGWSIRWLVSGAPFAVTLLSILGTHEFGHYFTAR